MASAVRTCHAHVKKGETHAGFRPSGISCDQSEIVKCSPDDQVRSSTRSMKAQSPYEKDERQSNSVCAACSGDGGRRDGSASFRFGRYAIRKAVRHGNPFETEGRQRRCS